MAQTFPALRPSARSFKPGEYPIRSYRSQSGVVSKRIYGNKPTNYELKLTFQNIDDSDAQQIVDHYLVVAPTLDGFKIPDQVFAGMSTGLEATIQAPSNISWFYAAPPEVSSVFIELSTVEVSLIGEVNV